jgi:hypothetical protein
VNGRFLTLAQRRAYIDTSRRSQPIEELRRKATRAKRRCRSTVEEADLTLAESHDWYRRNRPNYHVINFCSNCSSFGGGAWNDATKRFALPVAHKSRCWFAADDGPYPGWSAVSSPVDQPSPIT